jgi:NAD(P)-dependent dehydrogenase (short-subunit alcohol dehydrogenase family)
MTMLDLTDRVFLISGANRGIGLAVAEVLYTRGCRLSLGVRDPKSLDGFIAARDAARIHVARYDAENWNSHAAWVETAASTFGRIDGLVNNAGIGVTMTIRDADEAALDRIWAVNCKAVPCRIWNKADRAGSSTSLRCQASASGTTMSPTT